MFDPDVGPELIGATATLPSEVKSVLFNCNSQSEGRRPIIPPLSFPPISTPTLPFNPLPRPPPYPLKGEPVEGIKVFDLCTLLLWLIRARGPPGTTLGGEAVFICSPPPIGDFGLVKVENLVPPPFNPDVDLVKRRRPLVKDDDPPEGEDGDSEEDIKLESPKPRVGRFAEERDAFRPRVAKNPPVEEEVDDKDVKVECLMEVEMGERGIVTELEEVEEFVSMLAGGWV